MRQQINLQNFEEVRNHHEKGVKVSKTQEGESEFLKNQNLKTDLGKETIKTKTKI